MKKSPLYFGLILFGITMFIFFFVYYFFANVNYFKTSMAINSFGLTFIYAIIGFISVFSLRKGIRITFGQAFKQAFVTLFIGGFMSLLSIYAFLNFVDTGARDMLNYQYVQLELTELDKAYVKQKAEAANLKDPSKEKELDQKYVEYKAAREQSLKEKRNYFSFNFLSGVFGAFLLFYILLSIVIAGFLKNKKRFE